MIHQCTYCKIIPVQAYLLDLTPVEDPDLISSTSFGAKSNLARPKLWHMALHSCE